ncbi:MAG: hypothetical protein MJZ34_13785 [Paludibacteraceae bacterium]|nr:hypothetical protein [Paludibacteraceae bacterium]
MPCKETFKETRSVANLEGTMKLNDRSVDYDIIYTEQRTNNGVKEIIVEVDYHTAIYLPDDTELKKLLKEYITFHVTRDQMDYHHRVGIGCKMEDFIQGIYLKNPPSVTDHGETTHLYLKLVEVHDFVEQEVVL